MVLKVFLLLTLILGCYSKAPLVKTPLGKISGFHKNSFDGRIFSAFEGIPYAKPPVGERRFEEPEPVESWIGVWNATLPSICAQTIMTAPNLIEGDEDCLHINVYVPRETPNPDEKLDVVVHIHGGAYLYGSAHTITRPDFFMDREVIFVNFNYRLGVFGFLSTQDDVVPGNNGLKDQAMALKWVHDNIASFGGNPDSVTLAGISAGGSSTHLHYFSELSRNLFHRGVSHSGTAINPFSIQKDPLTKTRFLAEILGCPTSNSRILVDCLKQRPFRHVLDKIRLFFVYLFIPCIPFGPVVEKGGSKPFLSEDPYSLLSKGQFYDVPFIASTTTHEGLFPTLFFFEDLDTIENRWNELGPILLDFNFTLPKSQWDDALAKIRKFYLGDEKINKQNFMKFTQMFSDRHFLADAETAVRLQSKVAKSPVYYYTFGYPGSNNEQKTVMHGRDSRYFFGDVYIKGPFSSDEIIMKNLMLDLIVSYAKTGTPNFADLDWKPTGYDQLTYLSINGVEPEENKVQTVDELTSRKFWNSLKFREGENLISVKDEL